VHFCVLYGSQDGEPIISLQAYNIDWLVFLPETELFTGRYELAEILFRLISVFRGLQHVEHNVKYCTVKG
jgi:hypothetical protein